MSAAFLVRFLCELIRGSEHHVARNAVVPRLGAALRVDVVAHCRQTVEQVEGLQLGRKAAFQERAGQLRVPYEVVGVIGGLQNLLMSVAMVRSMPGMVYWALPPY